MGVKNIRLSNFVSKGNEMTIVYSISMNDENDKINGVDASKFKPIRLTDQWLSMFGFKKNKSWGDSYELNSFIVDENPLRLNEYFFRNIINNEELILLKDFRFVHELQNLYFTLTDEELTFSL